MYNYLYNNREWRKNEQMNYYELSKQLLPYIDKYSFWLSIALFFFWGVFRIPYIQRKLIERAKNKAEYYQDIVEINNQLNNTQINVHFSWYDIFVTYNKRTHILLILSLIFAYLSFNIGVLKNESTDFFFKTFSISTTILLALLSYIQKLLLK